MAAVKTKKNKGGRPRRSEAEIRANPNWEDKAKIKRAKEAARLRAAPKRRVTPVRGLEKHCRELIPGYDPWANTAGCHWSKPAALKAIRFFQERLTHVKGHLARQPFILEPWQHAIIGNLFGWLRPDGTRRYREGLWFVPRKNGKTPCAAGVLLYALLEDGEPCAEIYGAAAEYGQASLVFEHARGMLLHRPELQERVKIYNGQAKSVVLESDFSTYKVISSDAYSKHGYNTHIAVMDELHTQKNRSLYDTLKSSVSARRNPMFLCITTSDFERDDSICNEVHEYASQVRDGLIDDPYYLPVIYQATLDEDWTDEAVWKRANPNLGISKSWDYMREACKRAQNQTTYLNTFLRLDLNIRTEQDVRWLDKQDWDKCASTIDPDRLNGEPCYAGLDLASTSDLTAFVLLFPMGDGKYWQMPFFWCPEDAIAKRSAKGDENYRFWRDKGLLRTTPGNMTDYAFVRRDINEIGQQFDIREIAVDRLFQGAQLASELMTDGFDVISFGQGMMTMAAPTLEYETIVKSGRLMHGNHLVMNWMAANVSVELDSCGNMKPNKKRSSGKIDGIVAAIMALGRATAAKEVSEVGITVF